MPNQRKEIPSSRGVSETLCMGAASGADAEDVCIYLLSGEPRALVCVRPGPRASEQRLSHRLWQGEPWPKVGPDGIQVSAGRCIPALAELQMKPVSQEPEGLGLGLVDL